MAAPASCLFFGSYETAKMVLNERFEGKSQMMINFVAGLIAECVSCILWLPIDVIKERLQVQSELKGYHYRNSLDAIKQIHRNEGFVALYRGYFATVLSYGTFVASNLAFYEKAKSTIQISKEYPFINNFMIAFCTGTVASLLTNPLDLAKVRMQVQRTQRMSQARNPDPDFKPRFNYRNVFEGMMTIVREESYRGLWRGCGARVIYMSSQAAVNLSLLDQLRTRIIRYSQR